MAKHYCKRCKYKTKNLKQMVYCHDTGRCRIFECSECGYGVNDIYQKDEENYPVGEFNYCPHCGAKIGEGKTWHQPAACGLIKN